MRFLGLVLVTIIVTLRPALAPAQAEVSFTLSERQLDCLRRNAQVYRAAKQNPLFIPLNECPNLSQKPLLGTLLAEGPSSIRVTKDTGAGDTFIYVTKTQLDCLIAARTAKRAKLYRFYPENCRLVPLP